MIKVRFIRLWKLTKFSNPNHVYEIDMILMDEEGGKIQCNVEAAFIPRLGKLLEEYATVFIERPTIGLNVGSLKNVDNEHRLYSTIQLRGNTIFVTLWECFAKQMLEYVSANQEKTRPPRETKPTNPGTKNMKEATISTRSITTKQDQQRPHIGKRDERACLFPNHKRDMLKTQYPNHPKPEKTSLVIILQFGRLNYYMGRPYVNNTYRSSKLFINDNIDDIVTFKIKIKVQVVKTTNDEQGEVVQKEETEVFWCSECQNNVVSASPRFILSVRVQGLVGVVTLTLVDREVSEILNITGREVWRAKLTPDTRIISQLEIIEKKLTTEQEVENEMYNDTLTDPPSQETVNLKDDTSETGDNSTPISPITSRTII
ncbi:hypothetical protein LXL04_035074 [Taraxacum kok-saghyz]